MYTKIMPGESEERTSFRFVHYPVYDSIYKRDMITMFSDGLVAKTSRSSLFLSSVETYIHIADVAAIHCQESNLSKVQKPNDRIIIISKPSYDDSSSNNRQDA